MSDLFYVFGGALAVLAVGLSFLGLRSERFPASRGLLAGGIAVMTALVGASCAFAIVLAREEADHRAHEIAEFEAEQTEAAGGDEATAGEEPPAEDPGTTPPEAEEPVETEPPEAEVLELSSPEDGSLVFDTGKLDAGAGEVSIAYTNPSAVPHNVAIEAGGGGEPLAQGATVTGGDTGAATTSLEAGKYTFFCSIPGHREAGMEGTLTVK